MTCYNCGLPEGTNGDKGRSIQITLKPENGYQRSRKLSVWCCSDECSVQALGLAKWGPSHKWPVSLAKFRSTVKFDPLPQPSPPARKHR
jgi:hypothetical protein